jgi:hypothetical protein
MKYSIGPEDRRTLDELNRLRQDAQTLLDAASPAAPQRMEEPGETPPPVYLGNASRNDRALDS